MREKFNSYTVTRPRLRKTTGWFLVAVGFIAIILPVIPGAPILFVGLEILGLRMIFQDSLKRMFVKQEKATHI